MKSVKSTLYSGTSWTFLKLNTLAGLTVGHGDVIASPHFTPSYDVIALEGLKDRQL